MELGRGYVLSEDEDAHSVSLQHRFNYYGKIVNHEGSYVSTIGPETPFVRLCFLFTAILAHIKKYDNVKQYYLRKRANVGHFPGGAVKVYCRYPSALGRDESQVNTHSTEFGARE